MPTYLYAFAIVGASCSLFEDEEPLVWKDVSSGGGFSCGVLSNGSINCWGVRDCEGKECLVVQPPLGSFKDVACSTFHCCARTKTGTTSCWGFSEWDAQIPPSGIFSDVSTGHTASCGVQQDSGKIVCWGCKYTPLSTGFLKAHNKFLRALGDPPYTEAEHKHDTDIVCAAPEGSFEKVDVGHDLSCAINSAGATTCWGDNDHGQADAFRGGFIDVCAGEYHACGIKDFGSIDCWGEEPGKENHPTGTYEQVTCGGNYSCARSPEGRVACWGDEEYAGKRGVLAAPEESFMTISAGEYHVCGVTVSGDMRCWGCLDNTDHGQCSPPSLAQLRAQGAMSNARNGAVLDRPNPAGIDWVSIPGGNYQMGTNDGDGDEIPIHTVRVGAFQMSRSEVTAAQFRACVEAEVCNVPMCQWGEPTLSESGNDDNPVYCVDWVEARVFAHWAGGRLPSEAEWEYAAGGGQSFTYAGSDSIGDVAWYEENSDMKIHAVCGKRRNGYGLCDLSGNLWEWVEDVYHESYTGAPTDGSARISEGSERVLRGGSLVHNAWDAKITNRYQCGPDLGLHNFGFRIVRSPISE